jgi:Xaa-Pro aminopeptidase
MINRVKYIYDEYKKYGNTITDHDEILLFYPDYYKTKVELENTNFISKEEVDKYFKENYKNSEIYEKLIFATNESSNEIYHYMLENKNIKYECLKQIFESLKNSCINLCELIDYIGHYPSTWPVPKEEEKNKKMEALMEKYDIAVRYHLNDELDKMQISSDDIVRIIDKLLENLKQLKTIQSKVTSNFWLTVDTKLNKDEILKEISEKIQEIEQFPLSEYQKEGKSRREESKKHLRLQYDKNYI